MSTFSRKLESPMTNTEKLKQELTQKFPVVFSGGLGKCTKMKAQFQVRTIPSPYFKKKSETSREEQDWLEKADIEISASGLRQQSIRGKNLSKLQFAPIFQQG